MILSQFCLINAVMLHQENGEKTLLKRKGNIIENVDRGKGNEKLKDKTRPRNYQSKNRNENVQRNGTHIWDRWQWELLKCKEGMIQDLGRRCTVGRSHDSTRSTKPLIHNIDPKELCDPIQDGKPVEVFVGRGSFSVVRLQLYRGI